MQSLIYRRAAIKDAELLLKWANDPDVRKNSINQSEIPWESHLKWFSNKLSSLNTEIYIFLNDSIPIGQLRLDLQENTWVIDYSIDRNYRGQGFGKLMLKQIIERFPEREFTAIVKIGNTHSSNIFSKLGFEKIEYKESTDLPLYKFVLKERK
jgi:RimJ/RimL family protein N-acetyltransferase